MGGLICSCTSSKKMRRFRLCPEDFSLSTSISPAVLATFSILPVRKCTHNMNTFRMAWLSWLRAKVSKCINGIYLWSHIGDRLLYLEAIPTVTATTMSITMRTRQRRRRELAHCIRKMCRFFLLYPLDEKSVTKSANDSRARAEKLEGILKTFYRTQWNTGRDADGIPMAVYPNVNATSNKPHGCMSSPC